MSQYLKQLHKMCISFVKSSILLALPFAFCSGISRADTASDVSAILDILQDGYVITVPVDDEVNYAIAQSIVNGLFFNTTSGGSSPYLATIATVLQSLKTQTNAVTYSELQQALRAFSASNSADTASIVSALAGLVHPSDLSYINLTQGQTAESTMSLATTLSGVVDTFENGDAVQSWVNGFDTVALEQLSGILADSFESSLTSWNPLPNPPIPSVLTGSVSELAYDINHFVVPSLARIERNTENTASGVVSLASLTLHTNSPSVSDTFDTDEPQTNLLASLSIPSPSLSINPFDTEFDPSSLLPTDSGNPVITIIPAFSLGGISVQEQTFDFSENYRFVGVVHTLCVWFWNLLFVVAVLSILRGEWGYWSSLGSGSGE